jgi:hypothetical protein
VLAAITATLALTHGAPLVQHTVGASPTVVGATAGVSLGAVAAHTVDGTAARRLAVGVLGVVAGATLVVDVTGQFFVLDGTAHWFGTVGVIAVLGLVLTAVSDPDDPATGITYFYLGLGSVGVAAFGLYLVWTTTGASVGGVGVPGLALVLLGGLLVTGVGLRIWGGAADAVPVG